MNKDKKYPLKLETVYFIIIVKSYNTSVLLRDDDILAERGITHETDILVRFFRNKNGCEEAAFSFINMSNCAGIERHKFEKNTEDVPAWRYFAKGMNMEGICENDTY